MSTPDAQAVVSMVEAGRSFWERVFLESLAVGGSTSTEGAAADADAALLEWKRRFAVMGVSA